MDEALEGGRGVHPEARRDGGGWRAFVVGLGVEASVGAPTGKAEVVCCGNFYGSAGNPGEYDELFIENGRELKKERG